MTKYFWQIILAISVTLGVFIRVYKIQTNYYFTGELGKELLYVKDLIAADKFPLVGLATSHEWLHYGPLYYWKLIPLVKIFGGSPFVLFWFALAVSVAGLLITYWVFSKTVGKKFAALTTLFISLSPLWIWASRLSKLHVFFFVLIPLCIYFLHKIWQKDRGKMFWLGISYGMLFSFHFSQLPMVVLFAFVFYLRRKILKFKDYSRFVLGIILPNITVFIYDAGNGFEMIKNLFLWIPYRLLGFLHLYPKNNLTSVSAGTTLSAFNELFGRNLFWDNRLWILGSLVFLIMYFSFFVQNRKKIFKDFFVFYLVFSTAIQCFALVIHTSPPIHYFMLVYLNFALLLSHFILKYSDRITVKILTPAIFVLLFVTGILSINFEHVNDTDYLPLKVQENVADYIIRDAKGEAFRLSRVGPYDYFPETYNQNYKYLILLKGGKVDPEAKTEYKLFEGGESVYVQRYDGN